MKKSIERVTYCFVIMAALFVILVSFIEPVIMKDVNIIKVLLVLICYAGLQHHPVCSDPSRGTLYIS